VPRIFRSPEISFNFDVLINISLILFWLLYLFVFIIFIIIKQRLLAVSSAEDCHLFLLLSITGHVSLFPLLFTSFENVIKIVLVSLYSLASYSFLCALHSRPDSTTSLVRFRIWERIYLYGLALVALNECCLHSIVDRNGNLPFLPLLIMSVYCAIGVIYVWLVFLRNSLLLQKTTKVH